MTREYRRLRKRIMLNLDGTGQAAFSGASSNGVGGVTSAPVSNVARIGRATLLEDEVDQFEQIVYYQSGVGSGAESGKLQSLREGGFGVGLVSNVREAYGFLCNNYDFHDEIYITGFSRGAFTARSVAGLIGKVGILTKKGLDQFYEAFDYYEHPEAWKECPVSEEAGTTRKKLPDTDSTKRKKIKIKAVGVWDTVVVDNGQGALSGDYAFHEVSLGEHIENGFHMLSLNEKRAYFEPTLWEVCGKKPRGLKTFEQCWMPGDHSNIGGSWEDQQLADISLAWMMSRLESVGLKFDKGYLYHEFLKFETPRRQWGEGQLRDLASSKYVGDLASWKYGGVKIRTPVAYYRPEKKSPWLPWNGEYLAQGSKRLENTNETFHPSLRYRHYCKNAKNLGAQDQGVYDTTSMAGWTWPDKKPKGRIECSESSPKANNPAYSRRGGKETVTVQESCMGFHEQVLLAIYNKDVGGNIWHKVLGGDGPPQNIKETVDQIIADYKA